MLSLPLFFIEILIVSGERNKNNRLLFYLQRIVILEYTMMKKNCRMWFTITIKQNVVLMLWTNALEITPYDELVEDGQWSFPIIWLTSPQSIVWQFGYVKILNGIWTEQITRRKFLSQLSVALTESQNQRRRKDSMVIKGNQTRPN